MGRVFTLELNSGDDLKKVTVPSGAQRILLEGTIGSLKQAAFVEDTVFELVGTEGTFRVDLSRQDLAMRGHKESGEPSVQNPG